MRSSSAISVTIAIVAAAAPSNLAAHGGRTNSAGCHNDRVHGGYHCHGGGGGGGGRSRGYGGGGYGSGSAPAGCGGELLNAQRVRADVEALARACYADAYFSARGAPAANVEVGLRVRGSRISVEALDGATPTVDRCIRDGLRQVHAQAEGGCVDEYVRVALTPPRIATPDSPVSLDDATFAVLAALEPETAPLAELLTRTWRPIVPQSRLRHGATNVVDLHNMVLVVPDAEFLSEPTLPAPPLAERGNIARVWLYMLHAYDISMTRTEIENVLRWDAEDPIDDAERERNRRVRRVQGNANLFVGDGR